MSDLMSRVIACSILAFVSYLSYKITNSIFEHYKQLKLLKTWVSSTLDAFLSEDDKEIAGNGLAKLIAMEKGNLPLVKQWHNEMFLNKS